MKKLLSVLCIFILIFALGACSPTDEPDTSGDVENPINVSITFKVSDAIDMADEDKPDIADVTFSVEEKTNVMDATQIYCVANDLGITIDEELNYITGLVGINSADYGEMTGWVYTVNDEVVMVAANEYTLEDGDKIVWEFIDFSE